MAVARAVNTTHTTGVARALIYALSVTTNVCGAEGLAVDNVLTAFLGTTTSAAFVCESAVSIQMSTVIMTASRVRATIHVSTVLKWVIGLGFEIIIPGLRVDTSPFCVVVTITRT